MEMRSPMDTPGSQALETARGMKDLTIFKKPTGAARRSKTSRPTILDEDAYVEKMGEIIQRDFFPHLEKLKAQNDYLSALEQNDAKKMRELYAKYSSGRPATERAASPATFETPQRETPASSVSEPAEDAGRSDGGESTKDVAEDRTGLDAYLSSHTSEDNASFEEMMGETEKRRRAKFLWLYEAEEKSKLMAVESGKEVLAIARNGKKQRPFSLDGWGYKNRNFIMYVPDGVELTSDERIDLARRKQEVVHGNTRLTANPFNDRQNKETITELAKTQSKANDGKIGVDGKEVVRNPTPRINGFNFVASTPSPRPGECESPLMTWGQIEGTPFRLDGGDTPLLKTSQGPSFRMAEPPKREKIAMQLAEKAGERHRDRKNKALEAARRSLASPSPRCLSTIDRLSTMSPAARRLATQKLRIACTPSPRRSSSRTPSIGVRTPHTPRINPATGRSPETAESDDGQKSNPVVLTDNLLNLPLKRQRAADFFNK